jgi:hypothetical protein
MPESSITEVDGILIHEIPNKRTEKQTVASKLEAHQGVPLSKKNDQTKIHIFAVHAI